MKRTRDVRIGGWRWGVWAWRWGCWLRLGPVLIGLRSHRHHRPFFSERNRSRPGWRYVHLGQLCLVLAPNEKR